MNNSFPADKTEKIVHTFSLSDDKREAFLKNANEIIYHHGGDNPEKIINAISEYADCIADSKGQGYKPNIFQDTRGDITITRIDPPCGSNTYILETKEGLLVVDSGYSCFAEELMQTIRSLYPNFDSMKKEMIITHIDMDHMGAIPYFDRVYLNETSKENFILEKTGRINYRTKNPDRAPFYHVVEILTGYTTPSLSNIVLFDSIKPDHTQPLSYIGELKTNGLTFAVYEGYGGHVEGSMVFIENEHGLMITGDILINREGYTPCQLAYNRLPALLAGGSVNEDSKKAVTERHAVYELLKKQKWLICPGHGAIFNSEE